MNLSQTQGISCPQCHQIDQVQKVTAVVSSESSTGSIAGRVGASQTVLGQRLALPTEPRYRNIWVFVYPIALLSLPFFVLIALVTAILGVRNLLVAHGCTVNSPFDTYCSNATDYGSLQLIGAFLSIAALIAIIVIIRWRNRRRPLNRQAYEAAHKKWELAAAKWNHIYYCHRDDGVFIPGDSPLTPAERMHDYLYQL